MKKIIFDTSVTGHHLEYLHHLYEGAQDCNDEYIFVIPETFVSEKDKFVWKTKPNVIFDYIEKEKLKRCSRNNGYFASTWQYARLINEYVRKHNASELFLITLVHPYPFLPFLLPKGVKVSGIIYRLYVYEWFNLSFIQRLKDVVETYVIAKSRKTKNAYILNDNSAACYYNKVFHSNKFHYIVDPICMSSYNPQNLRNSYGLSERDILYFHFGAMTARKGTLTILRAFENIEENDLHNKVLILAGKIGNDIKKDVIAILSKLQDKMRVIINDEFCSYEFLSDWCYSSDYILIPYKNFCYSSGVLGYAATFEKTLIAPSEGILGKLIRRNRLGITVSGINEISLKTIIESHSSRPSRQVNGYAQKESISEFQKTVFGNLS